MRQLESLDLSRNSLRGEIPNSKAAVSFLSDLNLYNHLRGKIPESTQLQNHDCGPPLPSNYSKVHGALQEENDNEEYEIDWFWDMLWEFWLFALHWC